MIKVICDRCGREIASSSLIGYVMLNFRQGLEGVLMSENPLEHGHYCPNCMGEILKFIAAESDGAKSAEAEPDEQESVEADTEPENVEPETKPSGTESDELTPAPAQEPPNKPKSRSEVSIKPNPRRTIDYGKIMALRNAGWSREKIADEMGMTPNAVSNAVYTYNKRKERGLAKE